MWFRKSLIILMVPLSGCVAPILDTRSDIPNHADLSLGSATAVIKGFKDGILEPETCHIYDPALTMKLVMDAGKVSVLVSCFRYGSGTGKYGRTNSSYALFEFVAKADHTYRLERNRTGVSSLDLIDVSDRKRLILRRTMSGPTLAFEGSSKADVVMMGGTSIPCQFNLSSELTFGKGHFIGHSLKFDPGPVAITVRCIKITSPWIEHRVKYAYGTELIFEASAGHIYTIKLQGNGDNRCVQVTDVTTRELRTLMCEPAEVLDELLGLTRSELQNR